MPRKLTLEYVKDFVSKKSDGKAEVISDKYINDTTELKIRCECGKIFERKFSKIRPENRSVYCKDCMNKIRSEKYRLDFEKVIDYINSNGCEYISGEYENSYSKLLLRCSCGKEFYKSYGKFKSGQTRCNDCANDIVRKSKIKYSIDFVEKKLSEKGYTIKNKQEYVDSFTPLKCLCARNHDVEIKFNFFLRGQSGCKKCADINNSSKNHWNYKNGNAKVIELLRHSIKPWKMEVRNRYNGICPISHETEYVEVHHLYSFNKIIEDASKETGVPILDTIKEYDDYDDFLKLKEKVIEKHNIDNGILLRRKIHRSFHSKYGIENNNPNQFDEFLKENYNVSLEELKEGC